MKSELIHLLSKLKSDHPDFQNLTIYPGGSATAMRQHGVTRFESLDALEAYAWPQETRSSRGDEALINSPSLPSLPSVQSEPTTIGL